MASQYDEAFYRLQGGPSLSSAEAILPRVLDLVKPRSIVDVGCGTGTWLEVAIRLGVSDVLGLDGRHVHPTLLRIPPELFLPADLSEPFQLGRTFDLAICLEVAEHLPAASAGGLVESIVRHAPAILFSAAIPFQGGTNHVNERWPDYWAKLFARQNYEPLDCLRDLFWDDDRVQPCYAQNALLFVNSEHLAITPGLAAAKQSTVLPLRGLVHPQTFLAYANPDQGSVVAQIRRLLAVLRSVTRRRRGRAGPA